MILQLVQKQEKHETAFILTNILYIIQYTRLHTFILTTDDESWMELRFETYSRLLIATDTGRRARSRMF
jgi:hypothetical protein